MVAATIPALNVMNIKEGQFLFYDNLFRNAIIYSKKGIQNSLYEIDKAEVKNVYDIFNPGEDTWSWTWRKLEQDSKMFPVPTSFVNFLSYNNHFYALVNFNFPELSTSGGINYNGGRLVLMQYDTNMILQKRYILKTDSLKKEIYYINAAPSFAFYNDSLVIGVTRYLMTGKFNTDTSTMLFALFSLNDTNQQLVPYKMCGKIPSFFNDNKLSDYAMQNSIYRNEVTHSFVGAFHKCPLYYDFKSATTKNIPGMAQMKDTIEFNSGNDYQTCYYYNSPIQKELAFSIKSDENHFVCYSKGSYYTITIDKDNNLLRKIKLATGQLKSCKFFNDNHYLYAIGSINEYSHYLPILIG